MPTSPPPSPRRPGLHPLALLAVLAVAHLLFGFVLTRNTPFPYVPDDFSFLAGSLGDIGWDWKRPVSTNVIFLVAACGQAASYLALNAAAVLVAWLALLVVRAVTDVRPGVLATFAGATLLASHVATLEHTKYLGLMTSLVSHGFGLASLLLLWHAWRRGGALQAALAVLAFAASALAKEDFLLPPLLLVLLLCWLDRRDPAAPRSPWPLRTALALALPAVAAGSLAWNAVDRNPFVAGLFAAGGGEGAYAVALAPDALARALWTLFAGYSGFALVLALLACARLWWRAPALRSRLAWWGATVLALALPYAVIPNNMPQYRAYAWLPWLAAMVAIAIADWQQRARADDRRRWPPVVAAVAVGVSAAWVHHAPRIALAERYAAAEAVNRNMLAALERARDAIAGEPVVGLAGLEGPSPWCGNGTLYLARKRGFAQSWRLFADHESACYQNPRQGGRRPRHDLRMSVRPPAEACASPTLPVLMFSADGQGRLGTGAEVCATVGTR